YFAAMSGVELSRCLALALGHCDTLNGLPAAEVPMRLPRGWVATPPRDVAIPPLGASRSRGATSSLASSLEDSRRDVTTSARRTLAVPLPGTDIGARRRRRAA